MANHWEFVTTKSIGTGKKKQSDYESVAPLSEAFVKEILTEFELIVDSYEQPIERPVHYEKQKEYYSGKKKSHTKKRVLNSPSHRFFLLTPVRVIHELPLLTPVRVIHELPLLTPDSSAIR
ncbi:MAG: hypothetical protein WBA93_10355 [Microcoleaceae cyanobacterium]